MTEHQIREAIVRWSRSLFERRFTVGSSGNISVKLDDGYIFTPTNSCLGFLEPGKLSRLDATGKHVSGDPPTKELALHFAFYDARPDGARRRPPALDLCHRPVLPGRHRPGRRHGADHTLYGDAGRPGAHHRVCPARFAPTSRR
jgi:hypothetical protein